jgi:hypothetical protein
LSRGKAKFFAVPVFRSAGMKQKRINYRNLLDISQVLFGIFPKNPKVVYTFCCKLFPAAKAIELWKRCECGQKCKLENE